MSLEKFFNPASIAVVGASQTKTKVGYGILASLSEGGYEGEVFPVNPKAGKINGYKCFPDIASIGEVPELVIIVVPAKIVPAVMEQCAKVGVKAAIIITAGFKEVGKEGARLEHQIATTAKRAGIRILGPNCLGVIAPVNKLNASFGGKLPRPGSIGYISQSGALVAAILDMANAAGIGFSKLVSIGNKADVNELDVLNALADDEQTRVIAGYLESISDGNTFIRRAEEISHKKPILLIKSGGTSAGARAASSHTGSLAGAETAYECVFERAGIIRCGSIKQQFDFAAAFAYQSLPAGCNTAVITNAGGAGIMAADAVETQGLVFAKLKDETVQRLSKVLPPAANLRNPIDVLGDALADRYERAINIVLDDEGVEAVLVLLTPQAMTDAKATAAAVVKITAARRDKPVFAAFLGDEKVAGGIEILRENNVPCYDSCEGAVSAIKAMADYVRWRSRPKRVVKLFAVNRRKVETIIDRHLRQGAAQIGESDSKEILEAYGFSTPKGAVAATADQAVGIAERIGYPVVMKIFSPDILHKSDVGGVKIGLNNPQEVMDAFDLMMFRIPKKCPDASILGVLVQQMCTAGKEVILGMNRDPHFGPLMMFGMGGTMVEVLKDVSFYLAPLTAQEARQMLVNTRTYRMLTGVRGEAAVDIDKLSEALQKLSQLVTEFPQIQQMDINPFMVGPEGTVPVAVDARITLEVKR